MLEWEQNGEAHVDGRTRRGRKTNEPHRLAPCRSAPSGVSIQNVALWSAGADRVAKIGRCGAPLGKMPRKTLFGSHFRELWSEGAPFAAPTRARRAKEIMPTWDYFRCDRKSSATFRNGTPQRGIMAGKSDFPWHSHCCRSTAPDFGHLVIRRAPQLPILALRQPGRRQRASRMTQQGTTLGDLPRKRQPTCENR